MLNNIFNSVAWDKDLPYRSKMIDLYTRVYNGTIYNHLEYFYFQERRAGATGAYIPINLRQPSVKTRFCKIVADNSVSLLFGSDHFPKLVCEEELRKNLEDIISEYKLNKIMARAATIGSTGSVIIFIRVFKGVLRVEPKNTRNIFPVFDNILEDKLVKVTEKYKVKGEVLIAQGYANIQSPQKLYWFEREWNELSEIYYLPYMCADSNGQQEQKVIDTDKTTHHNFGFVPAIWIRNLPQITDTNDFGVIVDGACTFEPAIDTNIEIDYQLSQAGRALKYSADPLLILKLEDDMSLQSSYTSIEGSGAALGNDFNQGIVRSASNAITIGKDDEAKLLEISGDACNAVLAYVRDLREYMIESISGNRSNADKVTAAQSGRAMQAMNQSLIWLADHLRLSYGDCGLLKVLQMIISISNVPGFGIIVDNKIITKLNSKQKITLNWPAWYPDTPGDKVQNANAIKTLSDAAMISKQTGIKSIADNYSIDDIEEEEKLIDEDLAKIQALQPKLMETQSI